MDCVVRYVSLKQSRGGNLVKIFNFARAHRKWHKFIVRVVAVCHMSPLNCIVCSYYSAQYRTRENKLMKTDRQKRGGGGGGEVSFTPFRILA